MCKEPRDTKHFPKMPNLFDLLASKRQEVLEEKVKTLEEKIKKMEGESERERKRSRTDEPVLEETYRTTQSSYSQLDLDDFDEEPRRYEEETGDERPGSTSSDMEIISTASSVTDTGDFSYGESSSEEKTSSTTSSTAEMDDDSITGKVIQGRRSYSHRGARRTCQTCWKPYDKQEHQRHFHWKIEKNTESTKCYHCFKFGAYRCVFCQKDFCRLCMAMHFTGAVVKRETCVGDSFAHMIAIGNLALQDEENN